MTLIQTIRLITKKLTIMKKRYYMMTLCVAVVMAACMLTSCTKEDTAMEPNIPTTPSTAYHMTMTLAAKGNAGTRSVDVDGHTAWQVGEQINMNYHIMKSNGEVYYDIPITITQVNSDGSAVAEGDVAVMENGTEIFFTYPYGNNRIYCDQKGTIEDVSAHYDIADGVGTAQVNGTKITFANPVSLKHKVSICRFVLSIGSMGGSGFEPSDEEFATLTIKTSNDYTYTITSDRVKAGGGTRGFMHGDEIYVAMEPITNQNLTFSVNGASATYKAATANGTLVAGKMYTNIPITLKRVATQTVVIPAGGSLTLNGDHINVSSGPAILCEGDATITLTGVSTAVTTAYGKAGIQAGPAGSTLTIQGSGSLTATGASDGAGIGSGESTTCGNIVIAGGTVTALGGNRSAGIGTGGNGSYCGDITISGGTVVAKGDPASTAARDSGGAGIGSGGGYRSSSDGTVCGKITITGGDVTATGGSGCAGIGSGTSYGCTSSHYFSSCGDIEISGGTVIANGGYQAAGIGSGVMDDVNNYKSTKCGNILISGGTVTATGGNHAIAIGSGKRVSGSVQFFCGTITITEGITKIVANNEYGPARPVGATNFGSACRSVTIDGVTYDNPYDVPEAETEKYPHLKLTNDGDQIYTIQPR
jgi:hypothetical protein